MVSWYLPKWRMTTAIFFMSVLEFLSVIFPACQRILAKANSLSHSFCGNPGHYLWFLKHLLFFQRKYSLHWLKFYPAFCQLIFPGYLLLRWIKPQARMIKLPK